MLLVPPEKHLADFCEFYLCAHHLGLGGVVWLSLLVWMSAPSSLMRRRPTVLLVYLQSESGFVSYEAVRCNAVLLCAQATLMVQAEMCREGFDWFAVVYYIPA